ncbi:MAG: C_GCAxxG_C_C family protein [Ruminococcaceae bacterium]|nr:C_GCAxxG_C_C family protein [Oscillospiraceae bacterium]MBR3597069.1 C_GCAxxG_C_C family protein [Clostridia bacterium]
MTFHEQKAVELFRNGCNCSQAVFTAFSDVTGIDEKTALRMSSSFGGGLGRLREVCGAVSGISLAAGCLWGYDNIEDKSFKTEHYALVAGMANKFSDIFGTYICRELLGIGDYEYSPVAEDRTAEYYASRPCEKCIAAAAKILDEEIEKRNSL